ncbi:helix-turn-helix transcriptional regulator [Aureibacillus halotolerans]|uniref:Putative DNA-binding transcriptional regulator YafY n=1 Tax=Aureibacillus halotolerans TaxID=1508390 RepID=A0A4R6TWA8_9BACI|nr:YafY family protein [Aureibacillus halotolerans]TDQ36115.1 putative DNA-binding transcriptional regulator YafY [Aureibacillus halotolerans]
MAKWDNMLAIVWLLSSKKSMTAQQLSERLEINVRTVYRYIDALCASGVPIIAEAGHDGGYRLPQTFKETPLFFEPNELLSLFHAASFAKGAGYPFEEELTKALEKIRHQLNDEQQHFLERHTSGFDVLFMQQTDSIASSLQQLEQAVAESQSVDILYDKRQGETSDERRIDPYGLYYQGNYWYIIAYCHLREGLRTFRVDRIRRLHLTSLAFERPKSFSLRDYIDRQWTQEPTMNVHIKGKPEIIDYLCRYFSQALQERKDNEAHFNINVEQVNGILPGFLVSFGTRVHVMQPSQLREAMAEVAQKLENYYKTNELS